MSMFTGVSCRGIAWLQLHRPEIRLRWIQDERPETVLHRADARLRLDHRLFVAGDFRLRFDDVDWRHRADFDAGLVVLQRLAREVERQLRDLQTFDRSHEVVIREAHRIARQRDLLAQLNIGDDLVVAAGEHLLPEGVDLEAAEQRLRIGPGEVRAELRIVVRERVGRLPRRVQRELIAAASKGHELAQSGVGSERVVRDDVAGAGEKVSRRLGTLSSGRRRDQERSIDAARLGDRERADLRTRDARTGSRGCSRGPSERRRRR